jgi:Ubiquitin carboxyl-terminal hydrolase
MWMSQKHLAGYSQQDAHEFFISVLNEIHNNFSRKKTKSILERYDLMSSTELETGTSAASCNCIIHQVFGGVLQSEVTCMKCGNVTTAMDPILDLSLDIQSGKKGVHHHDSGILGQQHSLAAKKKKLESGQASSEEWHSLAIMLDRLVLAFPFSFGVIKRQS